MVGKWNVSQITCNNDEAISISTGELECKWQNTSLISSPAWPLPRNWRTCVKGVSSREKPPQKVNNFFFYTLSNENAQSLCNLKNNKLVFDYVGKQVKPSEGMFAKK